MSLARRDLLKRMLAGAAGAQIAAWTGACASRAGDGDELAPAVNSGAPANGHASQALLRDAWARARDERRPLFVLVIPESDARYEHGNAWGQLLLQGSDETLARLAGCVLVAAKWAWVRDELGGVRLPGDAPSALFVPVDGRGATPIRVDVSLSRYPDWDESPEEQERPYRERLARMEAALDGVVDARPADPRELGGDPPAGAAWALDTGCAPDVIDHPELSSMISCGMGFLPPIATRFLMYLTDLGSYGIACEEER